MKSARMALAGSLVFLLAGTSSASAQTKDPLLEKLAADWSAAFAKGDAKGVAGHYTENGVRVTQEGGTVVGRAAIEKEFAAYFAGPFKGAKIAITLGSTQSVSADTAVSEGTYEVTGIVGPDGKPAPAVKGRFVNTIVKKGGAWLIASNAAVPPPPAK